MYMCLYVHACGMCCKIWRGDYCLQSVVRSGGEITVYKVNVYIPNTGMKSLNPGTIHSMVIIPKLLVYKVAEKQ